MRKIAKCDPFGGDFGYDITYENFTYVAPDKKPSEKNSRIRFMRIKPDAYVIVRPAVDRKGDIAAAPGYPDEAARLLAMKTLDSWTDYFYAKARNDKRWLKILDSNEAMLRSGFPVQFVCADPADFDAAYLPIR